MDELVARVNLRAGLSWRFSANERDVVLNLSPCRVRVREAVQEGEAIDEAVAAIGGTGGAVFRCGIALHGRAAVDVGGEHDEGGAPRELRSEVEVEEEERSTIGISWGI